jgi:archaellum biogenesis protein FlaJ (TadC family)
MTLLAMIDYGLLLLFFLGTAGLILVVSRTQMPADSKIAATAKQVSNKVKDKEPYILLGTLVALLAALTFFANKGKPDSD